MMDGQIRVKLWRIGLIVALVIGLGWPVISASAQQPRAEPASTPAASPMAGGAISPLSTAAVVPADVPLYVAVNLDTTSPQWTKAEELVRRAGLGDLLDQVIAGAQSELQTETNGAFDLHAFLGGEVGIAITNLMALTAMEPAFGAPAVAPLTPLATPAAGAAVGTTSGIVAVVRPANPDQAEQLAQQLVAQQAMNQGVTVTETDYRGVTIHAAVAPDNPQNGAAYARLGDFLILSATAADLEPLIDVRGDGEPALADQAPFIRVRQELPNDFLVYSYTNGPAYLTQVQSQLRAAAAQLGPGFPYGAALAGLNAFSGEVIWADDPGFRGDTITVPATGGTLPPAPANFDMTLDARVPADSLIFADSFDLGPTLGPNLDALGAVIAAAAASDPDLAELLPPDVLQGAQSDDIFAFIGRFLAFNPRTDLIDQLVGEWAFALSIRSLDPSGVEGIFISDAKNEQVLNDAVTKLAVWLNLLALGGVASAGGEDAIFSDPAAGAHTEEVNGTLTQVVVIPIPEMHTSLRLHWGVVNGQLVFSIGGHFSSYPAGSTATLADSPRYKAVMAELPTEHNGVFYLDVAGLIQLVQPLIEQELAAEQGASPSAVSLPDLSALQSFATVTYERDGLRGSSALLLISNE